MDFSKKRKADDNGGAFTDDATQPLPNNQLTPEDARKIIESFTKDQLLDILQTAVVRDPVVLDSVRSVADPDVTQRKLFLRGLGWETTTDKIRSVFSAYGEIAEAIVITDKATGKSKGYGFVTFKHIDGAIIALKEPNKKIDGRITVAQLAANGNSGGSSVDVSKRKIYVGNVPFEISSDRLLNHFSMYGDIEEGPLGFDKQAGKVKGFAFFVYKTEEGARASLVDPTKSIDGYQVVCKLATDGKKGKPTGPVAGDVSVDNRLGVPQPGAVNNMSYGIPGGPQSYGGYSGGQPLLANQNQPYNSTMPSSISTAGYGNQGPAAYGVGGGTGAYGVGGGTGAYGGVGGGTGAYGGVGGGTGAYGGVGGGGGGGGYGSGYGGPYGSHFSGGSASAEYGGLSNRMGLGPGTVPAGMGRGGYPDPSQLHQHSSGSRVPPGGMYNAMAPHY